MIRKSGVVIAVLLMLWPVTVSAQRNDDFPDTEGWAYQLHGHEIVAYFDLVTGTPIRTAELNGVKIGTQPGLTYPTPESAVAAVEALIANHLDLFRFDPAVLSDVYVELQTYLGETWVVWYHQIYEGMWVTRSAVVVEIKMDGTIMHLSAQVYPNISVDTTPTVTLEDALAIARDRGLNAPDGRYGTSDWWEQAMIASSELVVNVEPKNKEYVYSLAWNLLLEVPEEGTGQAIVDAHTGEVYMAFGGPFVVHVDSPEAEQPPAAMELFQNYPNPFRVETTIPYRITYAADVRLRVVDLLGRTVAIVNDGRRPPGPHLIHFDASRLSNGTYLYRLEIDGATATRSMVLNR